MDEHEELRREIEALKTRVQSLEDRNARFDEGMRELMKEQKERSRAALAEGRTW